MKTPDELRTLYDNNLIHDLRELEKQRVYVLKKLLIVVPVLIIAGLLLAALFAKTPPLLFICIIGGVGAAGFVSHHLTKEYVHLFKDRIISKIVEFIDQNLKYFKTDYIPRHEFEASKIFLHKADRYKGEDRVRGITGTTAIDFCELHAKYETRDNKNRRHYHTFFKGLFFIADFNKHFNGNTFVLPDKATKFFKGLGAMMQSLNVARPQLVKLEDPEFEREFVVYSTDQIEARYILSTSLMQRISEFRQKTGRPISISFTNSKMYIAIPTRKNMLEPKLFTTLLDFKIIKEYYEDLQLAIGIVESLNLNRRIWSKQ